MKNVIIKSIIISAIMLASSAFAQSYKIDATKSNINWKGEKVTGEHMGSINLKSGSLKVDGYKMSGEFMIDMTTITNSDIGSDEMRGKLVGHLKSDDFFSVANHPTATFKITKTSPMKQSEGSKANFRITGDLTIKGITHEISFPAHVEMSDAGISAKAKVTIDRSKWDVRYGSGTFFDNLGDKLIYDDFHLELALVGAKG